MELRDDRKSYIKIFLIGILVGCITRLLDYCSLDTLWSWSSVQTLLGFWMISNTVIVVKSSSNKCAAAHLLDELFTTITVFEIIQNPNSV